MSDTTSNLPPPVTVSDAVIKQTKENVLIAPADDVVATPSRPTVTLSLYNTTSSSNVYAFIIGLSLNDNGAVCLLQADGSTLYLPENPPTIQSPLLEDCAIALGAPGTKRNVTIPYIAGGRVYFSIGAKLTFQLNPTAQGAALVEPSVSNQSDPNYNLNWGFCEFTYNSSQLYANITFVDFVSLPIALTLTGQAVSQVGGIPADGLATVANGMVAQNLVDGAGWDQLVVKNSSGDILRVLSPLNGIVENSTLFQDYWTDYINQVWEKYVTDDLRVDMQSTAWSADNKTTATTGFTSNDRTQITFPTLGQGFLKPSARDIFAADSGAFAPQITNTAEMLNIGARIDAAINRSTLLINSNQPDAEVVSTYYTNPVTNHYGRVVHATAREGRGYTFPYDDVGSGGLDQSGFVADPNPIMMVINVGGGDPPAPMKRNQPLSRMLKRAAHWEEDAKAPLAEQAEDWDLEMGKHPKLLNEISYHSAPKLKPTSLLDRIFRRCLTQFPNSLLYTRRLQPVIGFIYQFLASFLALSMRALLSRVFILAIVLVFYFVGIGNSSSSELETQRQIFETVGFLNATLRAHGDDLGLVRMSQ